MAESNIGTVTVCCDIGRKYKQRIYIKRVQIRLVLHMLVRRLTECSAVVHLVFVSSALVSFDLSSGL